MGLWEHNTIESTLLFVTDFCPAWSQRHVGFLRARLTKQSFSSVISWICWGSSELSSTMDQHCYGITTLGERGKQEDGNRALKDMLSNHRNKDIQVLYIHVQIFVNNSSYCRLYLDCTVT